MRHTVSVNVGIMDDKTLKAFCTPLKVSLERARDIQGGRIHVCFCHVDKEQLEQGQRAGTLEFKDKEVSLTATQKAERSGPAAPGPFERALPNHPPVVALMEEMEARLLRCKQDAATALTYVYPGEAPTGVSMANDGVCAERRKREAPMWPPRRTPSSRGRQTRCPELRPSRTSCWQAGIQPRSHGQEHRLLDQGQAFENI
jgi:hypothetical protein